MIHYTDESLKKSFDFIESIVSLFESQKITTEQIVNHFSSKLDSLTNEEFSLLLIHSGYIPELYEPDSSQETLYSKLIESLVCSWAKRIGFSETHLQTQKSNKEDVTILLNNNVIVCDAKSFRLGRSQAAPNVKDTIKKEAYATWLSAYPRLNQIGGLVTFPSLHDWKKGSEAYKYFTSYELPIMMLFYEHLAYLLIYKYTAVDIINFLNSYQRIFPTSNKDRSHYWETVESHLFIKNNAPYDQFKQECDKIIRQKVLYTQSQLCKYLGQEKNKLKNKIMGYTLEQLRKTLLEDLYNSVNERIIKQLENISKFRC